MKEKDRFYAPGSRLTMVLGELILGGNRAGVFLQVPLGSEMPQGPGPWSETLVWPESVPILTPDSGVPNLSKESPFLIKQGQSLQKEWLDYAQDLWMDGWQNFALLWSEGTLNELTDLLNLVRVPVLVSLAGTPETLEPRILAVLAAGVQGVIIPLPEKEVWKELLPQIKSMIFNLEKEFLRPSLKKLYSDPKRTEKKEETVFVGFQGERGAFSELAIFSLFTQENAKAKPFKAFRDVFEAVLKGEVDYGLLPLENALAGSIHDNFDLILQYPDLHIVAETQIRIEHNLIALPGTQLSQIKKVLSHPQGLAQSLAFLDQYPQWERVPFYDTAGSVAHIAQVGDPTLAAIASAVAADFYGMVILKSGVETNTRNFTRFALVAPQSTTSLGQVNKASLVFSTAHNPGALSDCLSILSRYGLNMRKIESRPIHGKPWAYMFYVDVEVPQNQADFETAMGALTEKASEFRLLGTYPSQ